MPELIYCKTEIVYASLYSIVKERVNYGHRQQRALFTGAAHRLHCFRDLFYFLHMDSINLSGAVVVFGVSLMG